MIRSELQLVCKKQWDMHLACLNKRQNYLQNSLSPRTKFWVGKPFVKNRLRSKGASLVALLVAISHNNFNSNQSIVLLSTLLRKNVQKWTQTRSQKWDRLVVPFLGPHAQLRCKNKRGACSRPHFWDRLAAAQKIRKSTVWADPGTKTKTASALCLFRNTNHLDLELLPFLSFWWRLKPQIFNSSQSIGASATRLQKKCASMNKHGPKTWTAWRSQLWDRMAQLSWKTKGTFSRSHFLGPSGGIKNGPAKSENQPYGPTQAQNKNYICALFLQQQTYRFETEEARTSEAWIQASFWLQKWYF